MGKIEEATTSLEGLPPDGNASKIKIYEQLGDGAAEIGNFKQALEFYHKMVKSETICVELFPNACSLKDQNH